MAAPKVVLPPAELLEEAELIEHAKIPVSPFNRNISLRYSLLWATGGALLWGAIVYFTGYNIALIAIAIGWLAGYGASRGGRHRTAQKIGAGCAAFGYFLGQTGALFGLIVAEGGFPPPEHIPAIMPVIFIMVLKMTFSSISVVFLGFAVYEGWRIPAPHDPA